MLDIIILQKDDSLLTDKAFPVRANAVKHSSVQTVIDAMIKALNKYKLNALAAPQIGESQRIIAIKHSGSPRIPLTIIVNPVILERSKTKELFFESSPSVDSGETYALVPRSNQISLIGFDREGKKIDLQATGMQARLLLHAIDFLEGRNFLKKASGDLSKYIVTKSVWAKKYQKQWPAPRSL